MDGRRFIVLISLLAGGAVLAGCGAKPLAYHSAQEIPQGSGMFSGEEGAFVFQVGSAGAAKRPASAVAPATAEGRREFEDFREYQRWKRESANTPSGREFEDWREWQEWRKRQ